MKKPPGSQYGVALQSCEVPQSYVDDAVVTCPQKAVPDAVVPLVPSVVVYAVGIDKDASLVEMGRMQHDQGDVWKCVFKRMEGVGNLMKHARVNDVGHTKHKRHRRNGPHEQEKKDTNHNYLDPTTSFTEHVRRV